MSVHFYTREIVAGAWNVNNPHRRDANGSAVTLAKELEPLVPGKTVKVSAHGSTVEVTITPDATGPEVAAIDAKIVEHKGATQPLGEYRQAKIAAIDARTAELIAAGFEYPASSGNYFSLSLESQANIHGAYTAKDLPQFTYPVTWPTQDDLATITIADANDMTAFFLTALATLRGNLDAGNALKAQAAAATTVAEVDAVEDTR